MKPRIDFSYEDSAWLRPVSSEVLSEIQRYFGEHPEYKKKFENVEVKLLPDLPKECEEDFRNRLATLPAQYTMDIFLNAIGKYKNSITKPPAKYLLNFSAFPWDMDAKANLLYSAWELVKCE